MPQAPTQLQFLGHASFRLTTPEGRIVLIDPWINDNPFLPEWLRADFTAADLLLITHGHGDHFDAQLPQLLIATGAKVAAPPAVRFYLGRQGVPAKQLEPMNVGGSIAVHGLELTMTRAHHPAHIDLPGGGADFVHEAVGFIVRCSDGVVVYAAGDTAVFGDMRLLAELYQPTVALLPIGGRYTMGPREAAYAARLLGAPLVVPFHYGTYPSLTGTPAQLRAALPPEAGIAVQVLQAGDSVPLPAPAHA